MRKSDAHSFNSFENAIKTYRFRIGSRSWQLIDNSEPAFELCTDAAVVGDAGEGEGEGEWDCYRTSFATYPRTQNVHVFDFEKVPDELYSGEDTTNGRNLKLEVQFNSVSVQTLKDDDGADLKRNDDEPAVGDAEANGAE
jgi:hypothetical protein